MKNECQSNSRSVWEFTGCTERDPTGEFTGCTERVVPMDMDPICTRSQPEPLRHNDPRAGLDELLEEWPRHMSDCLANSQDWLSMHKTLRQRVTISERSTMQLYHLDSAYAQIKSYSKDDCQRFSMDSLMEAVRIKNLVVSSTPIGASAKESFKNLLKNDVILPEEIRGIEHLLLYKSRSKLLQERRDHARAVLLMQHRMETSARDPVKQGKVQGDIVEALASFSASRSSRSAKQARIRASRAA